MPVSLSVHLCGYLSVYPFVCLSVCLSLSVSDSFCLFIFHFSAELSFSLSHYIPLCLIISLSVSLYSSLYHYISLCIIIFLSVSLQCVLLCLILFFSVSLLFPSASLCSLLCHFVLPYCIIFLSVSLCSPPSHKFPFCIVFCVSLLSLCVSTLSVCMSLCIRLSSRRPYLWGVQSPIKVPIKTHTSDSGSGLCEDKSLFSAHL